MTYCHSLEYPLFFYPCKLFPQPFIQSSFNPLNPARRGRAVCSYDDCLLIRLVAVPSGSNSVRIMPEADPPLAENTSAILAHLHRWRVRAYTSIALHPPPAHLSQTCLVFPNPPSSVAQGAMEDKAGGNRIRSTLASGFALRYARNLIVLRTGRLRGEPKSFPQKTDECAV